MAVLWSAESRADVPQTVLHASTGLSEPFPNPGLIQGSDGNLYGTSMGFNHVNGSVFKIGCGNTAYTTLSPFTGLEVARSALVEGPDHRFYSTVTNAGLTGPLVKGGVFRVSSTGKLDVLAAFMGPNGANPTGPVVFGPDGNIYGTTFNGGADIGDGFGTVFKLVPDTGALTTLYDFGIDDGAVSGAHPRSRLVLAKDGRLYGTTYNGGQFGGGTVFRITTDGQFSVVASFPAGSGPHDLLQATDGNFYGRAFGGMGRIFSVTPAGAISTLHALAGTEGNFNYNFGDGRAEGGALLQAKNGKLYGTAPYGGTGRGTVFELALDGTFTVIYTAGAGAIPLGLVEATDGHLYGTFDLSGGGIFKLTMPGGSATPALCPPAPPAPDGGSMDAIAADAGSLPPASDAQVAPPIADAAAATDTMVVSLNDAAASGTDSNVIDGSGPGAAATTDAASPAPILDAGSGDAATDTVPSLQSSSGDGCGCNVSRAAPGSASVFLTFLGLAFVVRRRANARKASKEPLPDQAAGMRRLS